LVEAMMRRRRAGVMDLAGTAVPLVGIDCRIEDLSGKSIDAAPITSRARRKATMYVVGDSEQ